MTNGAESIICGVGGCTGGDASSVGTTCDNGGYCEIGPKGYNGLLGGGGCGRGDGEGGGLREGGAGEGGGGDATRRG